MTTIFLDGDVNNANSIAGNTGGLDYNVDNTDEYHDFKVDGNTKVRINNNMTLSYETLDLQDNMIQNVSKLWLNGSTANDMFLEPDGTGNTLIYNVPTSHKHRFDINNSMALQVSNTYVTATNNLSVILNAEVAGLTIMNGGGLLSASGTGQESIRSASSTYKVGYHVSNSTSIGSDGSMGIPYKVFSGTVSLLLDSFFGTKDGSIGLVKNNSTGNVYFVARAGSSTWKYEQMA